MSAAAVRAAVNFAQKSGEYEEFYRLAMATARGDALAEAQFSRHPLVGTKVIRAVRDTPTLVRHPAYFSPGVHFSCGWCGFATADHPAHEMACGACGGA